jgi:hypothetical protein
MAIYRVATPEVSTSNGAPDVPGIVHVRFAPSEGAAKKFRRELAEEHGFKLDEVKYAPVDAKGGKAGTIAYLNAFHAQAPAGYVPAGYPKISVARVKKPAAKTKAKKR